MARPTIIDVILWLRGKEPGGATYHHGCDPPGGGVDIVGAHVAADLDLLGAHGQIEAPQESREDLRQPRLPVHKPDVLIG